jgi:hypothetical protein
LSTRRNGASPDAQSLKRRARASIAILLASVGALVLVASVTRAAYADDDDDRPLTASEVAGLIHPGTAGASETSSAASPPIVEAPATGAASAKPAPVAAVSSPAPSSDSLPETLPGARPASLTPELPTRPTFTTPAVPAMDNSGNTPVLTNAPGTQEIPQAMPGEPPVASVPANTVPASADMTNYINDDPDLQGSVGSARDFVAEGDETSPIGFEVRESHCRLKSGEQADGLLIVKVYKDSPAAKAGLQPYRGTKQHALQALAIGAGMAFPPAMLITMVALPMIEYTEIGKSYDMIIGVDGSRVNNFFDFEERMRNVQPGELVYLNLVRNGKRLQVAVPVPPLTTSASN